MSACHSNSNSNSNSPEHFSDYFKNQLLILIDRTPLYLLFFLLALSLTGTYLAYQKYLALEKTSSKGPKNLQDALKRSFNSKPTALLESTPSQDLPHKEPQATTKQPSQQKSQKSKSAKRSKKARKNKTLAHQTAIYTKAKAKAKSETDVEIESSTSLPPSPQMPASTEPYVERILHPPALEMIRKETSRPLVVPPILLDLLKSRRATSPEAFSPQTSPDTSPKTLETLLEKTEASTISSKISSKIKRQILTLSPDLANTLEALSMKISEIVGEKTTFEVFIGGSMATQYCLNGVYSNDLDFYIFIHQSSTVGLSSALFEIFPGTIFIKKNLAQGHEIIQINFLNSATATAPSPGAGTSFLCPPGNKSVPSHWDLNFLFPLSDDPKDRLAIEKLMDQNPLNIGSEKIFYDHKSKTAELLCFGNSEVFFQADIPESPIEKYKFMHVALKQLGRFIYHGCDPAYIQKQTLLTLWQYLIAYDYKNPEKSNLEMLAQDASIYKKQSCYFLLFHFFFQSPDSTLIDTRRARAFTAAPSTRPETLATLFHQLHAEIHQATPEYFS
jgi:hypothetical protein